MPIQIPTSWTSTGLDWTAPDPMWPLELLNPCLIEAILEKRAGTGTPLLSAPSNPLRPNFDYVTLMDSAVSTLIPLFVNHLLPTATPGNYNGQTTIPNWTEATILAAIGDSVRIIPTHLGTLSSWYFQTRKILDMMRWPFLHPQRFDIYWKTGRNESDWLAYPWQPGGIYGGEIPYNYPYVPMVANGFDVNNTTKGKYKHNVGDYDVFADVYVYPTSWPYGDFYNCPLGWVENKWNKILTISGTGDLITPEIGVISYPNMPNGSGFGVNHNSQNSAYYILKFDGPNGFKFRADTPST
jgi:hypothetical protein